VGCGHLSRRRAQPVVTHPSGSQTLVFETHTLLLSANMKIICIMMNAAWASGVIATRMSSHLEVLRSSKYMPKCSTAWIMAPTPKPAHEPMVSLSCVCTPLHKLTGYIGLHAHFIFVPFNFQPLLIPTLQKYEIVRWQRQWRHVISDLETHFVTIDLRKICKLC